MVASAPTSWLVTVVPSPGSKLTTPANDSGNVTS